MKYARRDTTYVEADDGIMVTGVLFILLPFEQEMYPAHSISGNRNHQHTRENRGDVVVGGLQS